jgi:PAS domain-containing protein
MLRPDPARWRTQAVSLRGRAQRGATWLAAWRGARPLLAYAASWVIALYVASALAFALSPKVEGPVPLYLTGPVTVAALVLAPRRHWWRYLVLTFPLIPIAFWLLRLPLSVAVVWVIVFVYLIIFCISVVTVTLLHRFVAVPLHFASVRVVSRFVACVAAGAVPAILIASTARTFVFSWDFWLSWQMGYLGYVLGIVVFTPAIVLWLTDGLSGLALTTPSRQVELVLLSLATVLVGGLVFGTHITDLTIAHTLIYLLVPLLIWAAIRFGPQGFASALTLTTAMAITGAVNNRGPFVGSSATANTLALQLFLLFVGVPLYFLASLVQERKDAVVALQGSEFRYRLVVRSLPHSAVLLFDGQLRHRFADGPGLQALGLTSEKLEGRTVGEALPAGLAAALAPYYDAALAGQAVEGDVAHGQHTYRVQVGPMPAAILATVASGTLHDHAHAGMVVLQDVTEQRRARRPGA